MFQEKPEPEVFTVVSLITPDEAQRILDSRAPNRNINPSQVDLYARAMRDDQWTLNGESIKFNPKGQLIDGQTRLTAVIKSGKPLRTAVTYNVSDAVMNTLDTGRQRSVSDNLTIAGEKNGAHLAAAARTFIMFKENAWSSTRKVSTVEVAQLLQSYPGAFQTAVLRGKAISMATRISLCVAAVGSLLTSIIDASLADDFERGLISGVNLQPGDGRLALRRFMLNKERNLPNHRNYEGRKRELITYIKAWNARLCN